FSCKKDPQGIKHHLKIGKSDLDNYMNDANHHIPRIKKVIDDMIIYMFDYSELICMNEYNKSSQIHDEHFDYETVHMYIEHEIKTKPNRMKCVNIPIENLMRHTA